MKSRCESVDQASQGAVAGRQGLAVDEAPRGDGRGARVPATPGAEEQRPQRRPLARLQPTAMQAKIALVHEVVAPEIEDGAAPRLQEFQPGDLPVAAVEDGMGEEEERPRDLGQPAPARRKNRRPRRPIATLTSVIMGSA